MKYDLIENCENIETLKRLNFVERFSKPFAVRDLLTFFNLKFDASKDKLNSIK